MMAKVIESAVKIDLKLKLALMNISSNFALQLRQSCLLLMSWINLPDQAACNT